MGAHEVAACRQPIGIQMPEGIRPRGNMGITLLVLATLGLLLVNCGASPSSLPATSKSYASIHSRSTTTLGTTPTEGVSASSNSSQLETQVESAMCGSYCQVTQYEVSSVDSSWVFFSFVFDGVPWEMIAHAPRGQGFKNADVVWATGMGESPNQPCNTVPTTILASFGITC